MGLEFLARVHRSSLWLGGVAALVTATYATPLQGLALASGVGWSLVNLVLLEHLVVALTGLDRQTGPARLRALGALAGFVALFAAGWFLLLRLPASLLMAGFAIPFAVIVLKAVALLWLPSRAWQRFTRTPFPAAAVVVVLALGVWAVASLGSGGSDRATQAATTASGAGAGAAGTASGSASQADAAATAGSAHGASGQQGAAGSAGATDAHGAAGNPDAPAEHGAADEHAAAAEEHGAAAGHGEDAGPQKFANVITILYRAFPGAAWAQFLHHYEVIIFALFIALLLVVVAMLATRNAQMVPGRLQNVAEALVEALYDFIVGILGPRHGPRYVPFLGTLFIYILVMNLFGLIPFMDSPTSSLNVTVALALVVFIYSQYIGFTRLGPLGWLDHMAGNPRSLIGWCLVPLMLPIHLMGELAKPISLAARLFGNIFGEDMLLVAFATLGVTILAVSPVPVGLPLQFPFLFLALLTSTLQALVFTVLSTIYFLLMLPHDDDGHEGEAQHAH